MVGAVIGKKIDQTQAFLEDGTRVPVTRVVCDNTVVYVKSKDKHGYDAVQLGTGVRKNAGKALLGHVKGAKMEKAPFFMAEVALTDENLPELGSKIALSDVFKPGDIIDVIGTSKGKGYAGVVKRHHFRGGPRTHGQSDRERAPGSIGQTTTPGRVYKGKRMAGRMGSERVTVKNLKVLDIQNDELWLAGLIPGIRGGYVIIEKVGEMKKFTPLYQEPQEESAATPEPETQPEVQAQPQEDTKAETQPQEEVKSEEAAPAENVQPENSEAQPENKEEKVEEGGSENAGN